VSTTLILLLVAAIAFLATHVVSEWLARRLLIVSGAEYLVLGVLLGPRGTGLLPATAVEAFQPFIILGIGWMGVVAAMPLRLAQLVTIPGVTYRLALVESLLTPVLVGGAAASALAYAFPGGWPPAMVAGAALGAIATASTPAGMDVLVGKGEKIRRTRLPVLRQVEVSLAMNALVAISAFGVLLAVAHAEAPVAVRALTTTEWVVVTLAIGVVGGTLFHLFLGDDPPEDRLVVALGGAVVLASGTAAHLGLSPTLATLTMGVVLMNSLRRPDAVQRVLRQGERPLYFALLLLAGASWAPPPGVGWWLVFVHYLAVRVLAKLWGPAIVTWWNGRQGAVGVDWGRALLGQGRLTLVLALDYARRGLPHGEVVFSCAVAAVLLTEFAAARLARNVVDAFLPEGVR
jgi:Kef-type K+ transport system membrane component KefB